MIAAVSGILLLFLTALQEPRLTGRVVDATSGAPIAEATIEILPSRSGIEPRRLLAGAAGEFEIGATERTHRIAVGPAPLQATHVPRIVVADVSANTRELVVALERTRAIDGRILDEFNEPMSGVRVVAEPLEAADFPTFRREHFSDDRGVFRVFGLASGRYRVCAMPQRPGRPSAYVKTCEPAPEGPTAVTIRVQRSASEKGPAAPRPEGWIAIRGRVFDEQSGHSLPRALVALVPDSGGDVHEAVADARGRFELHVPPGPYNFRAAAGEFKATHVARVTELLIMAGDTFGDFEIALARPLTVSGSVVDAPQTPLADVVAELIPEGATKPLAFEHAPTSDDQGRFRVYGVRPGRYTICGNPPQSIRRQSAASGWMYGRGCVPYQVPVGGDAVLSPIRIERLGSFSISGRILGLGSELPPGTSATLVRRSVTQFRTESLLVQPDGSFVAASLTPGVYELTAHTGLKPRSDSQITLWASARVEVVDADVRDVLLQLSEGATVRGRVAIDEPGIDRPLGGIEVRAFPMAVELQGPRPSSVETDDDGAFTLHRVFGSVVLRVRAPHGYVVKSIRHAGRDITDVPTDFETDAGLTTDILLSRGTAELSGRVRDDLGRAVEDAGVIYFPADPARWKAYEGGLRQQSLSGRYQITGIAGGDYLVIAVRGPRPGWTETDYKLLAPHAERVTVQDGEQRVLDLRVVTLER